jgi:TPR repeat protein
MALAKKEASSNIPNANKNLGVINMMRGNIEGAINFFEIDANQGDVESQTFLGMIYINSEYRFLDYSKAMYWFSLASEKNTLQQCII